MEQMEKTFYVALERQSLKLFEELMEQGEKNVMKNYWHVLELLLRLRQVRAFFKNAISIALSDLFFSVL